MLRRILGRDLRDRLEHDVRELGEPPPPGPIITDADLAGLPAPVQRYFRFMGVLGRPRAGSFRGHLVCKFRTRPNQGLWPAEIWQYNRVEPLTRVFWMRISVAGIVPMVGRDTYCDGQGRMLGKLLDRFVVADGSGEEFDIGELTIWLNDAVLMEPTLLFRADVRFEADGDDAFVVQLSDAGMTVSARVPLDDRGAPTTFESEDRWADLPGGLVRSRWSTPIDGWQRINGRALPTRGAAVWHLPEGDFTYADLGFAPDGITPDPDLPT